MTFSLALLPSPLLDPLAWQPVAQLLAAQGWDVVTFPAGTAAPTSQAVLDTFLDALPIHRELVLIPHSNAGAYISALTMQRSVVGIVFVDAVLPPKRGRIPLAPQEFLDYLRGKAHADGMLPTWTDWCEEADVAALFADSSARVRIEREQPRLPLSYFEDSLPVPEGWDNRPAAYLAFDDTYSREREEAKRRQWPVITAGALGGGLEGSARRAIGWRLSGEAGVGIRFSHRAGGRGTDLMFNGKRVFSVHSHQMPSKVLKSNLLRRLPHRPRRDGGVYRNHSPWEKGW
jgi:hypothetical protein